MTNRISCYGVTISATKSIEGLAINTLPHRLCPKCHPRCWPATTLPPQLVWVCDALANNGLHYFALHGLNVGIRPATKSFVVAPVSHTTQRADYLEESWAIGDI